MPSRNSKNGFTLVELLVVLAILAVLLTLVLVAVNPAKQMETTRNVKRQSDVNLILNAINQYYIRYGSLPTGITTSVKEVKSATGGADLCSLLVDEFVAGLPYDTDGSYLDCTDYDTGYTVVKSTGGNNRVTVAAPGAEGVTIAVTR